MKLTDNLKLCLYSKADLMHITRADNSLNHNMEIIDEAIVNKVDKEPGKGLSTYDYDKTSKDNVDNIPNIRKDITDIKRDVGNIPIITYTYAEGALLASGWDAVTKKYSFESEYPVGQYNIEIQPSNTCTTEQLAVWSSAQLSGSVVDNVIKANGVVPNIDIPITIKAIKQS